MVWLAGLLVALLALAAILPLLPLAHGLVRIGDFPRQQFLALAAALAVLAGWNGFQGAGWATIGVVALSLCAVHLRHVLPFTPLWRRQSADFDADRDVGEALRLMACNVKMSNRRHADLARAIGDADPDLVVLMEVDEAWIDALRGILDRYPHRVEQPQDNSYGMVLASRLPLTDARVAFLLTKGVPSIDAVATTPGGRSFRLISIHPEPPVPHRGTVGRDGETALVALIVREQPLPVIVTGDLNDVAWSRTTHRFRKVSRLLDPRIGRKVFSTFDARYPLLRWPLDHLFHSAEFRLADMRRLPPCGSDHFPVLFDLVLCSEPVAHSQPEDATKEEIERALDLVDQAEEREGGPIGADWEKS